ncbi:MAG: nucleoside-diphosphate kinase [Actinomyces succiniciruminis]|nr:nucleoside-diphosphate kinase [Actinomyces succiniciruminis]
MTDAPERILILLKPDAVERHLVGEILRRIEAKGYELTALKLVLPTAEVLAAHYAEHVDKPFYPGVVEYMTRGPVVAAVAEGQRVVEGVRSLMGATDPTAAAPGTIRGDLGRDWGTNAIQNLVHGSDSPASAEREIAIWFPEPAN